MENAVFVGRLCPLHIGHEVVIRKMIDDFPGRSLVVIGSSNAPISLRHFFSYEERRDFLRKVFPDISVVGLPDFNSDAEWMVALEDILSIAGFDSKEVVFFGGCEEDVRFFTDAGRKVSLVNRFDGSTPKISATEVRDALIHERPLGGLLDPAIAELVHDVFMRKWEAFKRM